MKNTFSILLFLTFALSCTTLSSNPTQLEKEDLQPMSYANRIHRKKTISLFLENLNDEKLLSQLTHSQPLGHGFRSTLAKLDVDGSDVFIKRIPLTQTEMNHFRSTGNLFQLPLEYQYGVGSTGFTAWRELAAHETTTQWMLTGENTHFPILYHWRILPKKAPLEISAEDLKNLEQEKVHWNGSESIHKKSKEMYLASHELVLFIEHIPKTLKKWIKEQSASGWKEPHQVKQLEDELLSTIEFMHKRGLYHFDSHHSNILTDGQHIYISDFGLATDQHFELTEAERKFIAEHEDYDKDLSITSLCFSILSAKNKLPNQRVSLEQYRTWVTEAQLPSSISATLFKYEEKVVNMKNFLWDLYMDPTKSILMLKRKI